MIYLDNAATSFPKPEEVYKAIDNANRSLAFNSGRGGYKGARKAQEKIVELKEELCKLVGLRPNEKFVYLTESATIASNVIVYGLDLKTTDVVYITPFEHNAIVRPLELLREKIGFKLKIIPFDREINLIKDTYRHMLSVEPATHIFTTLVGNVLGNVVDIHELLSYCDQKPIVTVDAAQAMGFIPIDIDSIGCNYMIFASHKTLYGPFGLGGIISTGLTDLKPIIVGGTGSDSLNTKSVELKDIGSPNISAVCGLLSAIKYIDRIGIGVIRTKVNKLREDLVSKLKEIDEIKIHPKKNYTSTGIIAFTHDEYEPNELAAILDDEFDIAVRSGFQCAPFVHDVIGTRELGGVVRVSIGWFNDNEDVDKIIYSINEVIE